MVLSKPMRCCCIMMLVVITACQSITPKNDLTLLIKNFKADKVDTSFNAAGEIQQVNFHRQLYRAEDIVVYNELDASYSFDREQAIGAYGIDYHYVAELSFDSLQEPFKMIFYKADMSVIMDALTGEATVTCSMGVDSTIVLK